MATSKRKTGLGARVALAFRQTDLDVKMIRDLLSQVLASERREGRDEGAKAVEVCIALVDRYYRESQETRREERKQLKRDVKKAPDVVSTMIEGFSGAIEALTSGLDALPSGENPRKRLGK